MLQVLWLDSWLQTPEIEAVCIISLTANCHPLGHRFMDKYSGTQRVQGMKPSWMSVSCASENFSKNCGKQSCLHVCHIRQHVTCFWVLRPCSKSAKSESVSKRLNYLSFFFLEKKSGKSPIKQQTELWDSVLDFSSVHVNLSAEPTSPNVNTKNETRIPLPPWAFCIF